MKAHTINLILDILMILSIFYAGVLLEEFFLSFFLLACGIILSQVRAIEGEN